MRSKFLRKIYNYEFISLKHWYFIVQMYIFEIIVFSNKLK